jgi:hypothetical protein
VMGKPLSTWSMFADACSRAVELQLRGRAGTIKRAVAQIGSFLPQREIVEWRRTTSEWR